MKRILVTLLILAVLAGGGYAAYRLFGGADSEVPKFTTAPVERGPIVARVTASGTLSALVTVQVGSQVSGRLLEIHKDFNDTVTKGEVIARIDPQLFEAAVELARANLFADQGNLQKAKVQATDAERQYKRAKALAEKQLIAQADVDTAQATYDAARASIAAADGQVARSRAALAQAQVNYGYTTISSPINGVIISRNVDVGQTVAASLQAPTLFTIAEDLRKMQVDTSVAEADVGKLDKGMPVSFTVDAFPGAPFKGTVRQIRNAPQTVQNVVTYDAVIDVDNPDLKLRPGMTANVTFIYAEKSDALRMPNAALRFRMPSGALPPEPRGDAGPGGGRRGGPRGGDSAGGGRTAWVLRAGIPERVRLKTGITDGTNTEILEGELTEGELVITESNLEAPAAAAPGGPGGLGGAGGGGRRRGF